MNIIDVAPIYVKKLNRLIKNKNQSSLNSQNDKEFKHILHILNRFIGLDALEMLIKGKSLEYICKGNIFLIDILKDKYTNLLEEKAQFCTETFLVKKYRNIVSDFNKLNIFNSTGLTRAKAKLLLDNYVLNNEKLDLKDTTFSGADLSGLDLSDIDFSGAKFYKTILINVNLSNSIFTWANLTSANLTGANLNGVNLNLCGLNGANICNADLRKTQVSLARFRNVRMGYDQLQMFNKKKISVKNAIISYESLKNYLSIYSQLNFFIKQTSNDNTNVEHELNLLPKDIIIEEIMGNLIKLIIREIGENKVENSYGEVISIN